MEDDIYPVAHVHVPEEPSPPRPAGNKRLREAEPDPTAQQPSAKKSAPESVESAAPPPLRKEKQCRHCYKFHRHAKCSHYTLEPVKAGNFNTINVGSDYHHLAQSYTPSPSTTARRLLPNGLPRIRRRYRDQWLEIQADGTWELIGDYENEPQYWMDLGLKDDWQVEVGPRPTPSSMPL
jgi:hypothetical protein